MSDPPDDRLDPPISDADDFDESPQDEEGVSLEKLSEAYAGVIGKDASADEHAAAAADSPTSSDDEREDESASEDAEEPAAEDDSFEVTPSAILEAILFVGQPENEPLTNRQIAARIRGVTPDEIDTIVEQLNQSYSEQGCPYHIVLEGASYSMVLRDEYGPLRDKFHGRIRQARLSQASVDVLAIIAYNQPVTREQVDEFRGRPSGSLLTQLVRRQLLRFERDDKKPRIRSYFTTDRFLSLFNLESLEDLPRSQELDRSS